MFMWLVQTSVLAGTIYWLLQNLRGFVHSTDLGDICNMQGINVCFGFWIVRSNIECHVLLSIPWYHT